MHGAEVHACENVNASLQVHTWEAWTLGMGCMGQRGLGLACGSWGWQGDAYPQQLSTLQAAMQYSPSSPLPQVEAPLKAGPQRDLDAYLQQLSTLQAAMQYLQEHDNLLAAQQAYGHAEQVGGQGQGNL